MDALKSSVAEALPSNQKRAPFTHRAFDSFLGYWHESGGQEVRRRTIFLICLATLCGATVLTGAVPTRIYGHDIFFLLGNGWRIVSGQRPHLDFYSPWGPVTFLITGLGLKLSHNTVNGVGYGTAVFGLATGLWSYALAKHRMESSPRIIASLFLTALVLAPYPLGVSPVNSSHAMVYNRYGYALLGLVMLEAFQLVRGVNWKWSEWGGGISSGAATALALFLKASYFLVAIALLAVSVVLWRRSRERLLGLVLGFVLVALPVMLYLSFDVSAIYGDLQMAAAARSNHLFPDMLAWEFLIFSGYLLVLVVLAHLDSRDSRASHPTRVDLRVLFLAVLTYLADLVVRFTNAQAGASPLAAVFALIVMNQITSRHRVLSPTASTWRASYARVLSIGALLLLSQLVPDVFGIAYGAFQKARPGKLASVVRFTEAPASALLLYDGQPPERSNGTVYTTYVNEGAALLRRLSAPQETVLTMDMADPFTYLLGRRPASGGMAALSYNYVISDLHHPSDDAYFGNADVVMVPKRPAIDDQFYTGFYKLYEPGLKARYRLTAETDWWLLYRRR